MVNITKLYCGEEQPADNLRYGHGHGAPNIVQLKTMNIL